MNSGAPSPEQNPSVKEALQALHAGGKAVTFDEVSREDSTAEGSEEGQHLEPSRSHTVTSSVEVHEETVESLTEPPEATGEWETKISRELDVRERSFTGTIRNELSTIRTSIIQWVIGIVAVAVLTLFAIVWGTNDSLRSEIHNHLRDLRTEVRREIDSLKEKDAELQDAVDGLQDRAVEAVS